MKDLKSMKMLKIIHLISVLFFLAILSVLGAVFGGEFLIIAENIWIIFLFIALLLGNLLFYITPMRQKFWLSKLGSRVKEKGHQKLWILLTTSLNIIVGVGLFIVYGLLIFLTFDMFTGILSLIYIVMAIPFIGIGLLCLSYSIKSLKLLRKREIRADIRQNIGQFERFFQVGIAPIGLIFVIFIAMFAGAIALYNPTWATGVEHTSLFTAGDQGRGYRIPSLIVLPGDVILAFAESRKNAMSDWGDIDLVMKRSIDGGNTWGPMTLIYDAGVNTAGNPCPVFDSATNIVWLPFCINNQRVYIMNSTDFGVTWSDPWEITDLLNLEIDPNSGLVSLEYGTGPGIGIQLSHSGSLNGRLIIPCYYFDGRGSHVIYSDDHGATWLKGENIPGASNECQIFETLDGKLCINIRNDVKGHRIVAWSTDGGESWNNKYLELQLSDPSCMASIIRYSEIPSQTQNRILFSNPNYGARGHLTIRLSYDEGITWSKSREVYSGPSAYSILGTLSDGTICVMFEQGKLDYRESIQFCRVSLAWLTYGQDTIY